MLNTESFKPNIVHAHPPPVPLRVLHKALRSSKCRSRVEMLREANKALPKNCVGPRWMLLLLSGGPFSLLFALLPGTHAARFGSPLLPGHREILRGAERRGCVVCHTVAGLFLASTSEIEGRSQRGLILPVRHRGGLVACWGAQEEGREEGKVH